MSLGHALPDRVALSEIDSQRELGWPDFHPEDYCHRCGSRNIPSWYVDSDRFNAAYGDSHPYNGIVCPSCFVHAHELATGMRATWRLVPDLFTYLPLDRWWLNREAPA